MNQAELAELEQSFQHVIVELDDGNQLLMFKCLKCDYVFRNNSNTRNAHWKRCPSKFFLKYVSQNERTGGIITACMKCHVRLLSSTLYDMKIHFDQCSMKWNPNPLQDISTTLNNGNQSVGLCSTHQSRSPAESNSVPYIYETMVRSSEIEAQRKSLMTKTGIIWVPHFKLKYITTPIGPLPHAECQSCLFLVKKPTVEALKLHRTRCTLAKMLNSPPQPFQPVIAQNYTMSPNIQSTIPPKVPPKVPPINNAANWSKPIKSPTIPPTFSPTIPSTISPTIPPTMIPTISPTMMPYTVTTQMFDPFGINFSLTTPMMTSTTVQPAKEHYQKLCFVCNTSSSESFVSLFDTTTKHTNKKVYDYIWKIQGNNTSIRNESIDDPNSHWNYVCAECLEMINEFDLSCKTFGELQKKIRHKLRRTEQFYKKQHKVNGQTQEVSTISNGDSAGDRHSHLSGVLPTKNPVEEQQVVEGIVRNVDEDEHEKVHYLVELSEDEAEVETIELDSD